MQFDNFSEVRIQRTKLTCSLLLRQLLCGNGLWFGGFHRQQLVKKCNKERIDFLKYLPLFWLTEGIAGVHVCVCLVVMQ